MLRCLFGLNAGVLVCCLVLLLLSADLRLVLFTVLLGCYVGISFLSRLVTIMMIVAYFVNSVGLVNYLN